MTEQIKSWKKERYRRKQCLRSKRLKKDIGKYMESLSQKMIRDWHNQTSTWKRICCESEFDK